MGGYGASGCSHGHPGSPVLVLRLAAADGNWARLSRLVRRWTSADFNLWEGAASGRPCSGRGGLIVRILEQEGSGITELLIPRVDFIPLDAISLLEWNNVDR